MWRLSRLDIKGFKSFAEAAELVFPEGITAVVGPNGCGKSNISDAIVWALGEQSTNVLRAQSMQDVIFQGSAERKANPYAEVTLHLVGQAGGLDLAASGNGNGTGPAAGNGNVAPGPARSGDGTAASGASVSGSGDEVAADADGDPLSDLDGPHFQDDRDPDEELSITRRLYRSGDSEYLMNGDKCLLRDIREKLLGTGLGFRACFTIGQGRIDQILSASPVERRVPIEEAAGISLYRRRRHRTNLKLEATAQDLARVEDICQEVARQMRSLKRQAGRAKRYRKLRDRLRALEGRWFSLRSLQVESATEVARAALEATTEGESAARETLEASSRAWETARREWREQRQRQAQQRQELYNAQVEHERARNEASRLRDRAAFAKDRVEEVRRKLEEVDSRREDAREVLEARRAAAAEAEEAARAAERIVQEASERLDPLEHLEREARAVEARGRERTLEILPLAARLEVAPEDRRALALALGNRLRQPVLGDEEIEPWLQAVEDRRGMTRGLRPVSAPPGPGPDPEPADVEGPLLDRVAATDAETRAVLEDLLAGVWVVDGRERVMELAAAHPGHAFVERSGLAWARGSEIVLRNEVAAGDEIEESSRRSLRLQVADEAPDEEAASSLPAEKLDAARAEVDRAESGLRAARAQAAAAQREVSSAEAAQRQADGERKRLEGEIGSLREAEEKALKQAEASDRRAAEAVKRCRTLEEELEDEQTADIAEEAEVAGLEAAVAAARDALEETQSRRSRAEVHAAEVRMERQHLHEQIRDRLDVEPRELLRRARAIEAGDEEEPVDADEAELRGLPPLELQRRIRDVREAIDRLGPVNLVAYEDFKVQEERFEELDSQRQDLVDAAGNLREAIRRIDEECEKRFDEAFEAIDGYFNRIFRQLFGGGRAGMRLENPDEPLTSGIEIVAQPPGKTLQSIRLMSGGERSMIALALMFAIFEYHPAPFCILDEADAALDDRNVGRFAQALNHFQDRAQFIMITHNKRTMEVADLLYGVTMEESGVSKLVSVELN